MANEHSVPPPPSPEWLATLSDEELHRESLTGLVRQQGYWLSRYSTMFDIQRRLGVLQMIAALTIGSALTLWLGPLPVLAVAALGGLPVLWWTERGLRALREARRDGQLEADRSDAIRNEMMRRVRNAGQIH